MGLIALFKKAMSQSFKYTEKYIVNGWLSDDKQEIPSCYLSYS